MKNNLELSVVNETANEKEIPITAVKGKEKGFRRVGTITVGISMVFFGIMFLLCSVFQLVSYQTVFALWPVVLILLGMELFVYSFFKGKLVYDKGSVLIMILMFFFSVGMAAADVCFKAVEFYITYLQ